MHEEMQWTMKMGWFFRMKMKNDSNVNEKKKRRKFGNKKKKNGKKVKVEHEQVNEIFLRNPLPVDPKHE